MTQKRICNNPWTWPLHVRFSVYHTNWPMCLAHCFSAIISQNGTPELIRYRYWQQMFGLGPFLFVSSIVQITNELKSTQCWITLICDPQFLYEWLKLSWSIQWQEKIKSHSLLSMQCWEKSLAKTLAKMN